MIEIPIGKAITAVDELHDCTGCYFNNVDCGAFRALYCTADKRKDGKNVIFKLVDYPDKPNSSLYIDGMRYGSKTTDGR